MTMKLNVRGFKCLGLVLEYLYLTFTLPFRRDLPSTLIEAINHDGARYCHLSGWMDSSTMACCITNGSFHVSAQDYYGYIMAPYYGHVRANFICMDESPVRTGSSGNQNGYDLLVICRRVASLCL
jgi:hypothetical protein